MLTLSCLLASSCGPNRAPSAPEIDIEPAMPDTTDDLQLVILEPSVDPDGDVLHYQTRWFQDGVIRERVMGDVVPADRTRAGEYWIAEIWATDGELDSPVAEATVFVFNTAPEATVSIRPDDPDTRENLVVRSRTSDLDGHEVSLEYSWTVDGVETDHSGDTVPSDDTAKHQRWAVEVVPYDGDSWGYATSAEVDIVNTAPGSAGLAIEPSEPIPRVDDLQCVVDQEAPDADGDELDYRLAWRLDGVDFTDAVDGELPGDTVPTQHTRGGQHWECRVWASDDEVEGPPARTAVRL